MKIGVVMPVYNEGETIRHTIEELQREFLRAMPGSSLFVFEDGSRDSTKQVLAEIAKESQWCKVQLGDRRLGYPGAAKSALTSRQLQTFNWVLFMDSDGQYDPRDFSRLVAEAQSGNFDIVMGRRVRRAEATYRVVLSIGLRGLEYILFRPACRDFTSALRLMKVDKITPIASSVRYSSYNFWLEFTARVARAELRVSELPVSYRARQGASRVYSTRKMPYVILDELRALLKTWNEREPLSQPG